MSVIEDRQETHGDFSKTARVTYSIKTALWMGDAIKNMTPEQIEALDMIAVKMARICNGDPNEPDHWKDIAGYAKLGFESIKDKRQIEFDI